MWRMSQAWLPQARCGANARLNVCVRVMDGLAGMAVRVRVRTCMHACTCAAALAHIYGVSIMRDA